MAHTPVEQRAPDEKPDDAIDQTLEDTLPASDAPAMDGATRIEGEEEGDLPGIDPDEDVPEEDTPGEPSPGGVPPDEAAPRGKK